MTTTVTQRVLATASGVSTVRVSGTASGGQTSRVNGYTALDGLALEGDQADGVLLLEGDMAPGKLLLEGDQQSGSMAVLVTPRINEPVA